MSLPIFPLGPITAVARLAGESIATAAETLVGSEISFDEVFRGLSGDSTRTPETTQVQSLEAGSPAAVQLELELARLVESRLIEQGFPVNPAPVILVQADGRLTVENDLDQAAQIESALAFDETIALRARLLLGRLGSQELRIDLSDLTHEPPIDTIGR